MNTKQNEKSQKNRFNTNSVSVKVFLTKDGNYLVHEIFGMRIFKHVNFYKAILGVEFTPVSKPSSEGSSQVA